MRGSPFRVRTRPAVRFVPAGGRWRGASTSPRSSARNRTCKGSPSYSGAFLPIATVCSCAVLFRIGSSRRRIVQLIGGGGWDVVRVLSGSARAHQLVRLYAFPALLEPRL
ncbi:MAG TPA: hypothetical protein VMB46_10345 [Methanomassiliicoccales archaeon]|nr:hypothetical protein [Methanomassiliicoccales archaeon]